MPIDWQTRDVGDRAHRFHRLTPEQVAAAVVPSEPGVHELEVDGETVYTWALHTPMQSGRPLRLLPVVYPSREVADAHGEVWAVRDREFYYRERGGL